MLYKEKEKKKKEFAESMKISSIQRQLQNVINRQEQSHSISHKKWSANTLNQWFISQVNEMSSITPALWFLTLFRCVEVATFEQSSSEDYSR